MNRSGTSTASAARRRNPAGLAADGVSERLVFDIESAADWDRLAGESQAMSLFAERRLLDIRLGTRKPDKAGSAALAALLERDGDADTVQGHVTQTPKRLGGRGLSKAELDDLVAYCHEMAPPPPAAAEQPAELVARGKHLFFADTVGCGTCHKDGGGSDGQRHEVGSGPKLDTPSLKYLAGTAPYFHDGSAETLDEAVRVMAKYQLGQELPDAEISALVAFLTSLSGEVIR